MEEFLYITPESGEFYKSNNDFLGLKFQGKDYTRVSLHRAFPFSEENSFISIRDRENKEIGIIKDLKDFSEDIGELFNAELTRRYLLPILCNICSVKEEFGYSYWDVVTNIGPKKFTIKKDNSSLINIKGNQILITDVDGNRYKIEDYTQLDERSYKLIELLL